MANFLLEFLTIGIRQAQKISATVKNSSKKFAIIIPCGPGLQLHHADYAMIYSGNLHSFCGYPCTIYEKML